MPRDADSLKIEKWAAQGSVADPSTEGIDRAQGWDSQYSTPGGKVPTREVFNELIREITGALVDVGAHGVLEWHASVNYAHPAIVFASDSILYLSIQDSTGQDPTTDASNTYWKSLAKVLIGGAITISDTAPASTDGVDGDIWLEY